MLRLTGTLAAAGAAERLVEVGVFADVIARLEDQNWVCRRLAVAAIGAAARLAGPGARLLHFELRAIEVLLRDFDDCDGDGGVAAEAAAEGAIEGLVVILNSCEDGGREWEFMVKFVEWSVGDLRCLRRFLSVVISRICLGMRWLSGAVCEVR
jgi:hypothetical protein